MTENNSNIEMNKHLFINIVTMLGMSAMQQLGKIINPATGKAEVSLEGARMTIDTLDMLAAKTRGNLDADEERLMKDTLSSLKLNFVETSEAEDAKKAQGGKVPPPATPQATAGAEAQSSGGEKEKSGPGQTEDPKTSSDQAKDPKYHKSYS